MQQRQLNYTTACVCVIASLNQRGNCFHNFKVYQSYCSRAYGFDFEDMQEICSLGYW